MRIIKLTITVLLTYFIIGCAGKPITFKSVDPKLYENVSDKGRTITAEAGGFQLLLVIPININDRHERALTLLKSKANGDYITDIRIKESWTYAFIGTIYTTTITATAYPKKAITKDRKLNLKEKLSQLKELYKERIISKDEYENKKTIL